MFTRSTNVKFLLAAAGMTLSTACASLEGDDHVAPEVIDVVGQSLTDSRPRGIYMVHDAAELELMAEADSVFGEVPQPTPADPYAANVIIYMNRNGGTFTPGNNLSSANRSSILDSTRTIAPWNVSDAGWNEVMSCVRGLYAPFNVEITDVDPGNSPHLESVVAGQPGDIGLGPNVGGVSPFTSNCDVINNSIVYTFAEVYGTNYRAVCEVVAQETAHSFGLDHEFLCQDPMTYLGGCGAKTFQDVMSPCGEDQERPCNCPWQQQNSVEMLRTRVGVGDGDTIGPSVNITFPADGAVVYPGFGVYVEASDSISLSRVELYIDGILQATDDTAPFQFNTPNTLAVGMHDVSTVAIDSSENQTSTTINVNVSLDADPDQTPPGGGAGDGSQLVGGCSASGSPAGSAAWLLLAMIFVFRRRRRS